MGKYDSVVYDNFQSIIEGATPCASDLYDKRNGIYVRNATFSPEAYLAYIRLLSFLAEDMSLSGHSAYLTRLGYIPIIMPPSFWEREVWGLAGKFPENLPFVSMRPISFRGLFYQSAFYDLWVSKMDIAAMWGWKPEDVTVRAVFEKCGI